jgi:hypothetical protein
VKRFDLKIERTRFGKPSLCHRESESGHYVYAFQALEAIAQARRDGYERALVHAGYTEGSRLQAIYKEFDWINEGVLGGFR